MALSGGVRGVPVFAADPDPVLFGELLTGVPSAERTVTGRNLGNGPLTVGAVSLIGPRAVDYAITGSQCTGAVGSKILDGLISTEAFSSVKTVSRRAPTAQSPKLEAVVETDSSKWGGLISTLNPKPSVVFNAVGTTRAAAGGIQNQWKIDHDLCIENAKAAKEAGVKTYVYISSAGTRGLVASYLPYSKMKVGVEDAIKALDFDQAVIVKPGMILGQREQSRAVEGMAQTLVRGLGRLSQGVQDTIGQDADVIARAAVKAAQLADEGKAPAKYWVVEAGDIIKLGRAEAGDKAAPASQ